MAIPSPLQGVKTVEKQPQPGFSQAIGAFQPNVKAAAVAKPTTGNPLGILAGTSGNLVKQAKIAANPPKNPTITPRQVADFGLSLVGTNTHTIAQATLHPLRKAENKGEFAPKNGQPVESVFPLPGPLKALAGKAVESLTADEAAQAVSRAAAAAKTQGFGRAGAPAIPRLKPGEVTTETGGAAGAKVREGLKNAPTARTQQKQLYREERSTRFGKAETALKQENPTAAFRQARAEFKGELPKIDFQGFKQFDTNALTAVLRHIKDSPVLDVPSKVRAAESIQKAIEGKVPTASEQRTLEKVFGKETSNDIVQSIPTWKKLGRGVAEVLNVPRAFQSAFDLSAPFRQGLVAGAAHPKVFFSEFRPMLKAARSEDFFQELHRGIREMPNYPLMEKAKLSLTGIGKPGESLALSDREEQFMANLADRIPGIGHGVRMSERAYLGFLNKLRADLFNGRVLEAAKSGVDLNDPHELESIGKVINAFTGRGDLGALQKAAPLLNTVFFSPRLLASRLNLIFGVGKHGIPGEYYLSLSPFARREALKGMRNLIGTIGTMLWLAKLNGAKVSLDPTNADFGKIRLGNTRIDIAGGFQQPVRLMAQLFERKITSSTTGKTLSLTQHGYGKLSEKDIIQRFVESKYAPVPSLINDVLSNKTFQGNKIKLRSEAYAHLVPLLAQDVRDLYAQEGALPAIGGAAIGTFGVGIQTYGPKATGGNPLSGVKSVGGPKASAPGAAPVGGPLAGVKTVEKH